MTKVINAWTCANGIMSLDMYLRHDDDDDDDNNFWHGWGIFAVCILSLCLQ